MYFWYNYPGASYPLIHSLSEMGSLDLDKDISPIPRSREENQERAFIAASRRKDRSLDARLESANRASMLHKKRTGKTFLITKKIVEKEAMYEEVDEHYQEKRIRMLQAQKLPIEKQFHLQPLATFASRANSSGSVSSIASRRANATPSASVDGTSSRKMSIDLSHLQSLSHSLTSPMTVTTTDGYAMSPSTTYDPSVHSYMNCMDGSDGSSFQLMTESASRATSSTQIPTYITQLTPSLPVWPTQMSWSNVQQQVLAPSQMPTDSQAVRMWQQQMMQQAQMPIDSASQMRQFRDRLASAPEIPLHSTVPPAPAASISGPSTRTGHGHARLAHSRGSSHPTNNFHNLQLLIEGTHLAQMGPSNTSSQEIQALSAKTQSTLDFCTTPNAPLSPTTVSVIPTTLSASKEGETVMVAPKLDPDYNEFCCDMRLVQIRNQAEPSELIPRYLYKEPS